MPEILTTLGGVLVTLVTLLAYLRRDARDSRDRMDKQVGELAGKIDQQGVELREALAATNVRIDQQGAVLAVVAAKIDQQSEALAATNARIDATALELGARIDATATGLGARIDGLSASVVELATRLHGHPRSERPARIVRAG